MALRKYMFKIFTRLSLSILLCLMMVAGASAQNQVDTDSLKNAIQQKRDSMIAANQRRVDSIKAETQRRVDSMKQAQAVIMDSIRSERDRRLDSLAAIKKYRESRHYRDSVEAVKQAFRDSITNDRLATLDSIKTERLKFTDSLKQAREHIRDSIQTMVAARRDSLIQAKNDRIAARDKAAQENKPVSEEERKKEAIDEKHEAKKEEYDNSDMLKKKWRFPRNALQNTYTRYNYYYNADLMYNEMLDRVYRLQKTNFDSIISVYRISPQSASKYGGSTQDDIIKKASLDIQMHDPRSKWQDDLFFLIARSYFYKDDLNNSIPYTKYIITHFKDQTQKKKKKGSRRKSATELVEKVETSGGKSVRVLSICAKEPKGLFGKLRHKPIYNDALMLLTRSYVTEGYHTEALSLLNQMTQDINFPSRLQGESDRILAQIYLQEDDYKQANEHIKNAIQYTKDKKEKTRLYFLQGQIYEEYENDDSAYYAFDRISKSNPDLDIEIQSYLKKTELIYKNGWTDRTASIERDMKKMLRQEKYREYYGQIHFNKGMLAIIDKDPTTAENEFTLSIETNSDSSSKFKALDQLVSFYYNSDDFVKANKYLTMMQELPDVANYKSSAEYVDHAYSIPSLAENQYKWIHSDSLIYLASLSEKDQEKWAKEMYEKEGAADEGFKKLQPQSSNSSTAKSNFYFSNPNLVKQGAQTFKNLWGEVKNVDNWAVSTLIKFNPSSRDDQNEIQQQASTTTDGYGKYLAMLPTTDERKSKITFEKQEAIYNLGNISYRQLNDPKRANKYFDTLITMYPLSEFRPKILFAEYLIAERNGDSRTAEAYKGMLQAQFPGSYAFMFQEYVEGDNTKKKNEAAQRYASLYTTFKQPDYPATMTMYESDKPYFEGLPEYENKSSLLYIQAQMGMQEYESALKDVNALIERKPEPDVLSFAEELKRAINKKLGNAVVAKTDTAPKMNFEFDPDQSVQVILELDSTDNLNQVKIALSDFNTLFFANSSLVVSEKILPGKQRVITIYNFKNYPEAQIYRRRMLEQWETLIKLPNDRQSQIYFINSKKLQYLFAPNSYEQYKTFFTQNFPQ